MIMSALNISPVYNHNQPLDSVYFDIQMREV